MSADESVCPACHQQIEARLEECPYCGIVFAKWLPRRERIRSAPPASSRPATPRSPAIVGQARPARSRLLTLLVWGLAGGLLVAGVYWWFAIRPRLLLIDDPARAARPSAAETLIVVEDPVSDFDGLVELPGSPGPMATIGEELVIVNRHDPWGFLRLEQLGPNRFRARSQPVIEPRYLQKVQLRAVAWDGVRVVGYTSGDWLQADSDYIFTIHDAESLQIVDSAAAPPLLGCLTWGGGQYWAATRKNTRNADEEAFLYRISPLLEVIGRYPSPGPGCQGMAWDGRQLWFADVFDNKISVLDVRGGEPEVVSSYELRVHYPSGLAFLDGELWMGEYDDDRMLRMQREFRTALASGLLPPEIRTRTPTSGSRPRPSERRAPAARSVPGLAESDLDSLRASLRSEDAFERQRAQSQLQDLGQPIDYARSQDAFASDQVGPEEIAIDDWAIELRNGALTASWRMRFGEELFQSEERARLFGPVDLPLFANYTFTVSGGTLSRDTEVEIEARPGLNSERDRELVSGLGAGRYQVDLFVHIQFVDAEGVGRILNQSAASLEVSQ